VRSATTMPSKGCATPGVYHRGSTIKPGLSRGLGGMRLFLTGSGTPALESNSPHGS